MKKHKSIEQTEDGFIYHSFFSNKCYKVKSIAEADGIASRECLWIFAPACVFFVFAYVSQILFFAMDLKNLLYISSALVLMAIAWLIIDFFLIIKSKKELKEKYKDSFFDDKRPYGKYLTIFFISLCLIGILYFGLQIAKDYLRYSNYLDFQDQKYEKIIDRNNFILKINPKYEDALFSRFAAYSSLEEYDKALVDINKILEIRPQGEYYIANKAELLYSMGKVDKAFELLSSEIEKNPKDIYPLYNMRSELYFKEGKLDEALSDLKKMKPEKNHWYEYEITSADKRLLRMAEIYEAQGDYCSALDNYNKLENKYLKLSLFYPQIKNAELKCKGK